MNRKNLVDFGVFPSLFRSIPPWLLVEPIAWAEGEGIRSHPPQDGHPKLGNLANHALQVIEYLEKKRCLLYIQQNPTQKI